MQTDFNHRNQPIGALITDWKEPAYPSNEPLVGRYCRLELLEPAKHAESLFAANRLDAQDANWTYLPYGPFDNLAQYRHWMETTCAGTDPLFYAIVNVVTNEAVGVASYLRISPTSGSLEVGHLNFSPKLQRTLAATEAMYLMMANAFALGYRRYEWKCNALNKASRGAALRLGLSFEGVFRQAAIVKGRNRDTAWYAAIDTEWPALQDAFRKWLDPANFDNSGQQRVRLSALTAPIVARHSAE